MTKGQKRKIGKYRRRV